MREIVLIEDVGVGLATLNTASGITDAPGVMLKMLLCVDVTVGLAVPRTLSQTTLVPLGSC